MLHGMKINVKGFCTVNGAAHLHDTKINGATIINGFLSARKSTFGNIISATKNMQLSDCHVSSITIKPHTDSHKNDLQIIELNNTMVTGSITFQQGNGKVIAKNKTVVKGNIVGGVLEAKK